MENKTSLFNNKYYNSKEIREDILTHYNKFGSANEINFYNRLQSLILSDDNNNYISIYIMVCNSIINNNNNRLTSNNSFKVLLSIYEILMGGYKVNIRSSEECYENTFSHFDWYYIERELLNDDDVISSFILRVNAYFGNVLSINIDYDIIKYLLESKLPYNTVLEAIDNDIDVTDLLNKKLTDIDIIINETDMEYGKCISNMLSLLNGDNVDKNINVLNDYLEMYGLKLTKIK